MKTAWAALAIVSLWLGVSGGAGAISLWSGDAQSLYVPHRAHQVGDLLTLIIVEKTEASQGAKTTTGRDTSASAGPGGGVLATVVPPLSLGSNDKVTAGGTTTRDGSLTAKMTVKVVDVLPNGNLVLQGSETMQLNSEIETITVSGVCRPEDVSADNTIESTFVADAKITYSGSGSLGDKQGEGLLGKLLSWIF